MSKKKTRSRCLFVDASVAGAAGGTEAKSPDAVACRDFLIAVRGICHPMAWSHDIKREWDRHRSGFAANWLESMMNLKKLRPIGDQPNQELRQAIAATSNGNQVIGRMLKDAHLVEAALATDLRVASLDEKARGHFTRLAATLDSLRQVMWVNPAIDDQQAIDWLEKGAPFARSRRLIP